MEVEKIKKELDEELEKITTWEAYSEISITSYGIKMNSPYPERRELNIVVEYKPYTILGEERRKIRNLKFALLEISNRLSELLRGNVVEDYEAYVRSFCTYCKVENGELIKCLRHSTIDFDLPNVIDLKSNRTRDITIRYSFTHVYKPVYISIHKEGWSISLFVYWKHLLATVKRPSGVTFTYSNLLKGKSVYVIAKLIKDNVIDFVRKELGTPYIELKVV